MVIGLTGGSNSIYCIVRCFLWVPWDFLVVCVYGKREDGSYGFVSEFLNDEFESRDHNSGSLDS